MTTLNTTSTPLRFRGLRHSLLASAIVVGLGTCAFASAQDTHVPDQSSAQKAADNTKAGNKATQQTGKVKELEAVTVTAQGREQDILKVPYNISVVSGDTIEQDHILDTAELMRRVPGVGVVDRGPRNSNVVSGIRIRGLNVDSSALGDYAVGASATVATYVDNTPLFANFLLSDINRVEVLRGPQGTLYGSGALGGAVRYLMNKPYLDGFSGKVSLSASSADHSDGIGKSGTVTLNIPLASSLALRFNGTLNRFPGVTDYRNVYVLDDQGTPVAPNGVLDQRAKYRDKKDADNVDQSYARVALLWKPNDSFDLTLSHMTQADNFGGRRGTTLGTDGYGVPYKDLQIGSVQLEPAKRHVHLTSLEANVDLGFATLTSSTSSYDQRGDITSENTGFYAQNNWLATLYYNYPRPMASAVRGYGDKAFIQELRLVSRDNENFSYVAGVFYENQHRNSRQDSYLRGFKQWWDAAYPAFAASVADDHDFLYRQNEHFRESAAYGELTWHATDTLDFTGGVRYFRDKTITDVHQVTGLYSTIREGSDSHGSETDSRFLFKGNVSWTFTPNNQLYATISEGYRRGGTNGIPTTGNFAEDPAWATYKPDTVRNYDIGIKGRAGRTTYNADVFYVDWKNPQINSSTTLWGFFAVQNVTKATTRGVELNMQSSIGKAFSYGLGYTYTDATLAKAAEAPDDAYEIAPSGTRLPGSPKHRVNAWASYGVPVGQGFFTVRGDAYAQSSAENALSQSPKFHAKLPGFSLFNLSATYSRDSWDLTLWMKNVTNQAAVTGIYTQQYMGTSPAQHYYGNGSKALVTLPRTVGLTFTSLF